MRKVYFWFTQPRVYMAVHSEKESAYHVFSNFDLHGNLDRKRKFKIETWLECSLEHYSSIDQIEYVQFKNHEQASFFVIDEYLRGVTELQRHTQAGLELEKLKLPDKKLIPMHSFEKFMNTFKRKTRKQFLNELQELKGIVQC